ncbi:MAG: 50S ribosomal protein L24e [Candidatus Diapherotrites archaeon]|nr:50S ribosomal protein L24e [Candidatus Diapherotrites archaeon]
MKCTFCGTIIQRGTGKIYAKKEGTLYFFCSMKCEKNLVKLGRKPTETKWSKNFAKTKIVQAKASA